jgi:hypothetical protein
VTVADPAAEHDVADGTKSGDLGHGSDGTNAERITVGLPKRMAATDGKHSDASIYSVSRHDAKHLAAGPNLAQHLAGSVILGSKHSHLPA